MKIRNCKDYGIILILIIITIGISILVFDKDKCGYTQMLGQFGDFYGGVIATIATIAAGVFLYKTYTNSKKDSDYEILNSLFNHIIQNINNIQYRRRKDIDGNLLVKEELYNGLDAIYNFDNSHSKNPNSVLNQINSILDSFENLIFMANNVLYKYTAMKEITLKRIYFLYYSTYYGQFGIGAIQKSLIKLAYW